jgi:hypothetical protein
VDAAADHAAALLHLAQRCRHQLAGRGEDDRRVERLGRRVGGGARPLGTAGEREIVSVANLTRADGERFMQVAARVPIETHVRTYPLGEANRALADLRAGALSGAAVLVP